VLSKAFVSVNTSVSAEPTQNPFANVSTLKPSQLQSAPTGEPPPVNPQPITDEEPAVLDEEERERCVLESRQQDQAREWEQEFYDDGYQHD
jgi:hypothetical protein